MAGIPGIYALGARKGKSMEQHFEAGNIYLAAYLVSKGCAIKGIAGSGRQKRVLFADTPEARSLAERFFDNSQEERLFQCYRKVKDFIFQNGV